MSIKTLSNRLKKLEKRRGAEYQSIVLTIPRGDDAPIKQSRNQDYADKSDKNTYVK